MPGIVSEISASAPGKIVVSGEYVVLDGAPAICMAVDRRARVTIRSSEGSCHTVTAPSFSPNNGCFDVEDGRVVWQTGSAEFALLSAVWQAAPLRFSEHLALSLDSGEFYGPGGAGKLGVGASAALSVALTAALHDCAGSTADVERVATSAHRALQHGLGSGVDIACSLRGGVVEFRVGPDSVRALRWPVGLAWGVLWSGVAVDTHTKLRMLQFKDMRPSRAVLHAAADRVLTAWNNARVAAILDELRRYTSALRTFSVDHELGIFDAGHDDVTNAANASGVVYKPCGAGGGDVGIVLAADAAAVTEFAKTAAGLGFEHLQMSIDDHGVRLGREEH